MNDIDLVMAGLNHIIRTTFTDGQRLLPADETRIRQFELLIGVEFPSDYRYFLSRYQGAQIKNVEMHAPVQHEALQSVEGVYDIDFFGFYSRPPTSNDLILMSQHLKEELPPAFIPVGAFIQQKYHICLSCDPETYGQVFVKHVEQADEDNPTDLLFHWANSFLDLLRSFRTMSDEEADEWYRRRDGS